MKTTFGIVTTENLPLTCLDSRVAVLELCLEMMKPKLKSASLSTIGITESSMRFTSGPLVHIWEVDLDAQAHGLKAQKRYWANWSTLTDKEQMRALSIIGDVHRRRWVTARAELRRLLGCFTKKSAKEVLLEYGKHGAPYLASDGPSFSLSHSEGRAVIAISNDALVGVDVERPVRLSQCDIEGISTLFMSASEKAHFASLKDCERQAAFFWLWVRKEAILKAIGTGFLLDPRDIDIGFDQSSLHTGTLYGSPYEVAKLDALWPAAVSTFPKRGGQA